MTNKEIPCSELKSSFSGENEKELHDNISVYVAECGKYNKMYKELHNYFKTTLIISSTTIMLLHMSCFG